MAYQESKPEGEADIKLCDDIKRYTYLSLRLTRIATFEQLEARHLQGRAPVGVFEGSLQSALNELKEEE